MKIAAWQAVGVAGDLPGNLQRLAAAASSARAEGADILVTPELFSTGYAPAQVFDTDGEAIRAELADIARNANLALVASTVDRDSDRRFISASFFDAEGTERTRYRKSYLFGEEERSVFVPGSAAPEVVDYAGLRIALGICYDVEFPEFVRGAARRGAEALLIPTAVPTTGDVDGLPANRTYNADRISTLMVPCRAMENGIFIAYANHAGPDFTGLSCISGPHGNVLAQAERGESMLFAHFDSAEVQRARRINTYLRDFRDDL
ncbi:nitrilase-related carbon-nitrogen hydrolase [Arthrobacter sp.]|uniref:nitrilase-related carbon-nitrogen hydrolase n=1 Tax=Arthrobacter sp. TaxID=1667 RepID=UPI002812052E|nr:nitrilase-related carbon-nitrogen hydrolase [Arthrobacter sp.]